MNREWKILVILVALIAPSTLTIADWQNNTANYHRTENGTASEITEQKAITIAQQHFKGRVLAINQVGHTYRIKILSDHGTVHTVLINAQDGSVISTH
ncbi:MAG: PepSY domain-containing protein [Nitrosomonas sp.]|uniref:PepSY domain-containing protein n=1 Tax=Nitrosomonas sp. TaxID=42353 RepID=UPI0025CE4AA6|nr:PepSY domain-containing protein [Nitrosomonas sp.]MBY0475589.1 PepSY domain-containing protein [Nitrosomonas sp.]